MEKDLKKSLIFGSVTVLLLAVYNKDVMGIKTTIDNLLSKLNTNNDGK